MSADTSQRTTGPQDPDDEQELDLGRYWHAVVTRWWLVLGCAAAGLVIGYITTLGHGRTYSAQAIVYLGDPLAPGAGQPVTNVPTQLALLNQVVLAESTIRRLSAATGVPAQQLRNDIRVRAVSGVAANSKVGVPAPVASITVVGTNRRKTEAAANAAAKLVVGRVSGYVDTKIQVLNEHLGYDARQIALAQERLAVARKNQAAVIADTSLSLSDRLISIQNFSSVVNASEARLAGLEADQFAVRQLLKLADQVERASVVTAAAATSQVTRSRSNSIVVGTIVGLIVGIVAALLWEPVVRRVGPKPA